MKILKYILPLKWRQFIRFYLAKFKFSPRVNSRLRLIGNTNLPQDFKETLKQMAYSSFLGFEVEIFLKSYLANNIQLIKKRELTENSEPILICAVKNDLDKVKIQVEHHRRMGVKHFIYIDNISTDGTFEWLKNQSDVTLYKVETTYEARTREGWCHLAIEKEGYGKWYLYLDSDELFAYPNMENVNIQRYISFLEEKHITVTTTPMIDMYSKNNIFEKNHIENIKKEYCFFDTLYYTRAPYINRYYFGGPRYRIFSIEHHLVKHSLLKMEKNMIFTAHTIFPFHKNFEANITGFLLHYKFLSNEVQKYIEIAKKGNYAGGSREYKTYMEFYRKDPNLSFYNSNSQKLETSMDLLNINIADKKFFEEFQEFILEKNDGKE